MNDIRTVILCAFVVAITACGGRKTVDAPAYEDSFRVDTPVVAVAEHKKDNGLWTEKAVADRVNEIYDRVNKEFGKPEVDLRVLDELFCSKDYRELYARVMKAQEGKGFGELCFIEYRPWDMGLMTPITVSNIRPKLLTGDMAEVFFDLTSSDGADNVTAGWTMYLEDDAWKVHDFLSEPNDGESIFVRMQRYVDN